jgi:iron complex outermembrane recepter protein
MKNIFILLIISFLVGIFSSSKAQSLKPVVASIEGIVSGHNGKAVEFATVILLKTADSSLIKGASADVNGKFKFDNIAAGNYVIAATSMGFKKGYSNSIDLIPEQVEGSVVTQIQLNEDATVLSEIVVQAQKPIIEQQIDRLVVNVESSILSTGNSALEVLEKAPGVMVDKDGNIKLRGKEGTLIMIDGKPTYLSSADLANMLRNMTSNQIEKLEIITNPSAKFDAAGNAGIINIKLKQNKAWGTVGSVGLSYRQGIYARENATVNLSHRQGKYSLYGAYAFSNRNNINEYEIVRNFRQANTIPSVINQTSSVESPYSSHSARLSFDYAFNNKTSVGIMGFTMLAGGENIGINNTNSQSLSTGLSLGRTLTNNTNTEQFKNYSFNLNIRHKFDSLGRELAIDFDHIYYNKNNAQVFLTDFFDNKNLLVKNPSSNLTGDLPSILTIKSVKIDYVQPLFRLLKLELGAKSSFVETDNNMRFFRMEDSKKILDDGRSNHFTYQENINAAYANLVFKLTKKLSFQTGLRVEQTIGEGKQLYPNDTVFPRNYLNFFPSVFFRHILSKKSTIILSYSRRIDRPSYQELNPFRSFLDPYTYQQGNPYLQPQFTNSLELTHAYEGSLTTSLNYSTTDQVITQVIKQSDNEQTTFQTVDNLAKQRIIGFSTILPVPISNRINMMNYVSFTHKQFSGEFLGQQLDQSRLVFLFNNTTTFSFSKGWSAEIGGFYQSKSFYGILDLLPIYAFNAGFQKQMMDKRATIKFSISDLFRTNINRLNLVYANLDTQVRNWSDTRIATISFNYKFGKTTVSSTVRKTTGAEDEKNRVKLNASN